MIKRKHGGFQDHPRKQQRTQQYYSTPTNLPTSLPIKIDANNLPPAPAIDRAYADNVFTHPSTVIKDSSGKVLNYDRLEFIGDAYIELACSQLIFHRFPDLASGRLSQIRESLVKNETLAQFTEAYGWDRRISNFQQLQRESPQAWIKIKGDIFEAYVGAVAESKGFQEAKTWLELLWRPSLDSFAAAAPKTSDQSKNDLAKRILCPATRIQYVDEKKPVIHHGKGLETFFVGVYLTGLGYDNQYLGSGKGFSKASAGQEAAAAALGNHPLIDEIAAKREEHLLQRKKEELAKEIDSPKSNGP
jgi:ribonuclease-3